MSNDTGKGHTKYNLKYFKLVLFVVTSPLAIIGLFVQSILNSIAGTLSTSFRGKRLVSKNMSQLFCCPRYDMIVVRV